MRLWLAIAALLIAASGPASAQTAPILPYTFSAAPGGPSPEICRGQYVFVVTTAGAPGNEMLYTLDSLGAQPDGNVRVARFLVDDGSIMQRVTDRAEAGAAAVLFVALKDPAAGGNVALHVTINGVTYTNDVAVPASQSQAACAAPAFYGAPVLASRR